MSMRKAIIDGGKKSWRMLCSKFAYGIILALYSGAVLLIPIPRLVLLGCLRSESFYSGRPTSWWSAEVKQWRFSEEFDLWELGGYWPLWEAQPCFFDEWLVTYFGMIRTPVPAIDTLLILQADPAAIPVLLELLKDEDPRVRWAGAVGLGRIGVKVKPAFRDILQIANDEDRWVQRAVWAAMLQIDEEAANKVGIHWEEIIPSFRMRTAIRTPSSKEPE